MPNTPNYAFNPPAGTYAREKLLAFIDVSGGSAASPDWALLGIRVEDSSMNMDWSDETKQDITGKTYTTMKKPVITQSFDSWELEGTDRAARHVWEKAVVDQDYTALTNQKMLICHLYAGFAEQYDSCMVKPTSFGGEGGGTLSMSADVTYGGTRTKGTAVIGENGVPSFTPEGSSSGG